MDTQKNKRNVWLSGKDRATHMQIIGATGTGKSKMMEWMIRQNILEHRGLCLIDPHASLYHNLVQWLEWNRLKRKVILFDPGEEDWVFSFNPLHKTGVELAFQMDSMVRACGKVWGDEDQDRAPLLKRCLRNIFYVLAEKNLTLIEALHLIDEGNTDIRRLLTNDIADEYTYSQWQGFNKMSPREFRDVFASTQNRLMEFLGSPRMRRIFGQGTQTVDFRTIMDEGYILLVNLSWGKSISPQNARMLGTLLVNDLFSAARNRQEGSNPFYLYIDEFAEFANEDTAQILDQCRKWGLHLVLAHQHLQQLKQTDEKVYHSVMTNAKTKLVFGGLSVEDTEILAKQIFMGEFDIDEVKHTLRSRKVMDYREETRVVKSQSHASGDSWSNSSGSVTANGYGSGQSGPFLEGATGWSDNSFWSSSSSSTSGSGGMDVDTYGESEVPFLVPVMGEEVSSIQFRSLEEQLYRAMSLMTNQPTRYGLLKTPNQKVMAVRAPLVTPGSARQERVQRYIRSCFEVCDFVKPRDTAEQEIAERKQSLLEQAGASTREPEIKATPTLNLPTQVTVSVETKKSTQAKRVTTTKKTPLK
jgi:hypothetical protein